MQLYWVIPRIPNNKMSRRNATNSRINKAVVSMVDMITARLQRLKLSKTKPKQQKSRKATGMTSQSTFLPLNQGFVVTNNSSDKSMRVTRSELMTNLPLASTDPVGPITEFSLNPASELFFGTILQQLARVHQKFKFERFKLRFGNVTGTANNGSIVIGYTENPDQTVNSLRDIFNLPGSKTFPLWMPIEIMAFIKDRVKKYNIDPDSNEIMQTTQGKFCLGLINPPTVTGTTNFPIFADYTVLFEGSATQTFGETLPVILPASGGVGGTGGHGPYVTLTPSTGGDLYAPALKVGAGYTPATPIWALTDPVEVTTSVTPPETVLGSHFKVRADGTPTEMAVQFFNGIDQAIADSPIVNVDTGTVAVVLTQGVKRVN